MPDDSFSPDADVAKPWYRSTTLQGLVVMLITVVLQYAKVTDPAVNDSVAVGTNAFFTLVGAVMVIVGRVRAKKIITATPAAAAKLNA